MVAAHDSKSCLARGAGSSPASGTDLSIARSCAGEEATTCFRAGLEDPADVLALQNRRGVPNL